MTDASAPQLAAEDSHSHEHTSSYWRRFVSSTVLLAAVALALSTGSAYTVAHHEIAAEFSIDESSFDHLYWPVTSWAIGGALFALIIVPLMEDFGAYYPFLFSWSAIIVFTIPQALAQNFATLIVCRFISGGFAGVIATATAGMLASLWTDDHRARGVWIGGYVAGYLVGSSIGPVIGAAVLSFLNWRWIFWVHMIILGIFAPVIAVALYGTKGPPLDPPVAELLSETCRESDTLALEEKSSNDAAAKAQGILRTIARAAVMLTTEPKVTFCTMWTSFVLGTIYLFTQSVEQVYGDAYGWQATQAGFVQGAIVVGEILSFTSVWMTEYLYWNSKAPIECEGSSGSTPRPETRLILALPGGVLGVSGGMLLFAWLAVPQFPWIAPSIGLAMVGWGSVTVVNCVAAYVVDAYAAYAGSAMVALAMGENTLIAFLPLATHSMYSRLGAHWASTLLALISLALSAIPLFVMRQRPRR